MRLNQTDRAFTLIEILVSISIVAILMAISFFGVQGARTSGRDAKRKADLETIRSGLEFYKADCDVYPATTYTTNWPTAAGIVGTGSPASCSASFKYLIPPTDPLYNGTYYRYTRNSTTTYDICAYLEGMPAGGVTCGGVASPSCGSANCNYRIANP